MIVDPFYDSTSSPQLSRRASRALSTHHRDLMESTFRLAPAVIMPLHLVTLLLLTCVLTVTVTAQDCTNIPPASGSTAVDGAVSILKNGDFYLLYQTWAAPAAGFDLVKYTTVAQDALQGAAILIGMLDEIFEGSVVYNSATDGCWNVEGNYGFAGGRMINYGCEWGPFTAVNFKFGPTSPDGDGWSQIGAEPSGVSLCLYVGSSQGDPLYTAYCDSGDDTQKFMFIPVGGANFLFLHKATLQCLYLASDGIRTTTCNVDDRTQLFQWCNHLTQDCVEPSGEIFNPC